MFQQWTDLYILIPIVTINYVSGQYCKTQYIQESLCWAPYTVELCILHTQLWSCVWHCATCLFHCRGNVTGFSWTFRNWIENWVKFQFIRLNLTVNYVKKQTSVVSWRYLHCAPYTCDIIQCSILLPGFKLSLPQPDCNFLGFFSELWSRGTNVFGDC